ncbi:hypothetical protein Syun_012099 [Stephania yunnanensis]|uniref:Uncharacterized protein n=1 Tax=Stephania yunnanensis TaxID=152371 RepID=A0AAP0JZL0_9MAGN
MINTLSEEAVERCDIKYEYASFLMLLWVIKLVHPQLVHLGMGGWEAYSDFMSAFKSNVPLNSR